MTLYATNWNVIFFSSWETETLCHNVHCPLVDNYLNNTADSAACTVAGLIPATVRWCWVNVTLLCYLLTFTVKLLLGNCDLWPETSSLVCILTVINCENSIESTSIPKSWSTEAIDQKYLVHERQQVLNTLLVTYTNIHVCYSHYHRQLSTRSTTKILYIYSAV